MTGAYPVLHVGSFGSPGPVRSTPPWSRTFRGIPASVPEARRFVAELLPGCPAREVLTMCVSELATNAIAHTDSGNGGVFIVEVDLPHPGTARLAVTDEGSDSLPAVGPLPSAPLSSAPLPLADPLASVASLPLADPLDSLAEGGRGLALVAASTTRWGYADAHPGRTVWAESCWPVPVPAPAQATSSLNAPTSALGRNPAHRSPSRRPRPGRPSPNDRPPSPAA